MKLEHRDLDVYPIPKEKAPMFINELWLIDDPNYEQAWWHKEPEDVDDNIRVYIPLDINKEAILRRLDWIIMRYQEANERNEIHFSIDVQRLLFQVKILTRSGISGICTKIDGTAKKLSMSFVSLSRN